MAASQRLVVMTEVPSLPLSILKTEPEIVANISHIIIRGPDWSLGLVPNR